MMRLFSRPVSIVPAAQHTKVTPKCAAVLIVRVRYNRCCWYSSCRSALYSCSPPKAYCLCCSGPPQVQVIGVLLLYSQEAASSTPRHHQLTLLCPSCLPWKYSLSPVDLLFAAPSSSRWRPVAALWGSSQQQLQTTIVLAVPYEEASASSCRAANAQPLGQNSVLSISTNGRV